MDNMKLLIIVKYEEKMLKLCRKIIFTDISNLKMEFNITL